MRMKGGGLGLRGRSAASTKKKETKITYLRNLKEGKESKEERLAGEVQLEIGITEGDLHRKGTRWCDTESIHGGS